MKSALFLVIVLISGFTGGIIFGFINFVTTEPFLDSAIELENRALFESGEEEDGPEFRAEYNNYRGWQKSGMVLAGGILGMAVGGFAGYFKKGIINIVNHINPDNNKVFCISCFPGKTFLESA